MSQVLYEKDGLQITRLYGGKDRGVCFQLTDKGGTFIQITRDQLMALIATVIDFQV